MKKITSYYGVEENRGNEFERLYKIELTETRYSKTDSNKSWKKNFNSQETNIIPFEHYFNYLSSVQFFKNLGGAERVEKGYTTAGFIPTQIISTNPDKTEKVIRHFKIASK